MNEEEYRLFKALNERVTDLAKSYRVLNENHSSLELQFVEFRAQITIVVAIAKWLIPISGLTLLLRILEVIGVVK